MLDTFKVTPEKEKFSKLGTRKIHFVKYKKCLFLRKYDNCFNLRAGKFYFPKFFRKNSKWVFFIVWVWAEKWDKKLIPIYSYCLLAWKNYSPFYRVFYRVSSSSLYKNLNTLVPWVNPRLSSRVFLYKNYFTDDSFWT